MELSNIDIHELLPQQEPFIMVGKLVSFDMGKIVTQTLITDKNIFVEDGVFTAPGLIENIAQTCATRIGYINKYILKKEIQLGFIGAIRNFKLHRCPKVGELIETTIITEEEVFGMTLVSATIMVDGEFIAESSMKIAVRDVESNK